MIDATSSAVHTPRRRRVDLSRPDQLEALASPVRHQLHQTLDAIGPCSVRELAARMGREPEALYYHLRPMLKAGIVVETGKRQARRRAEAVYDVAGRPLRIDPGVTTPRFLKAIVASATARLRLAERCLRQTIFSSRAHRQGPQRSFRIEQNNVRLTKASLKELNSRIDEMVAFLREHDDPDAEQFQTITIASAWSERGQGEAGAD